MNNLVNINRNNRISAYIDQVVTYIVCVCLIFGSKDTWFSSHNDNNICMYMNMIIVIVILGMKVLNKRNIGLNQLKIVIILSILVICSMIVNLDVSGYSMFIVFLIALMMVEVYEFEYFFEVLDNVIYYITLLSLAITMFWLVNPDKNFAIYQLFHMGSNESVPWGFRLYGIFREPAMFCIYLGLGLIRCLFIQKKHAYHKIIIYLIAIFLSGSTTGYIAAGFAMFCFLYSKKSDYRFIIVSLISFPLICIFAYKYGVFDFFVSKISVTGANSASSNSRYFSIIGGALVGIINPFFGAGAIKSEIAFNTVVSSIAGTSYCWANMVTYLWASFGCIFVFIFLRGIYGILWKSENSHALIFLIYICLLLCGETMTYSSIMYILMLYGYKNLPLGKIRGRRYNRIENDCGN